MPPTAPAESPVTPVRESDRPRPVESLGDEATDSKAASVDRSGGGLLVPEAAWELTFEEFREAQVVHAASLKEHRSPWRTAIPIVLALGFGAVLLAAGLRQPTLRGRLHAYAEVAAPALPLAFFFALIFGFALVARRGTRAAVIGLSALLAAFIAATGATYAAGLRSWPPEGGDIGIVIVAVLMWLIQLRFALGGGAVRKFWEGQPHLHDRTSLRVTAEGVEFDAPLGRSLHRWPAVEAWSETGGMFVLRMSRYAMAMVPKRAWPDPADADAFRAALRERAGRRTGFDVVRAGGAG